METLESSYAQATLPTPRTAGLRWPAMVLGLIGISLTICFATVYLAATDPSVAIEDDYYAKALHWDDIAAQRRANAQLGWSLSTSADVQHEGASPATVSVVLLDADGSPIADAAVRALAFHHTRRGDAEQIAFTFDAQRGAYTAKLPAATVGLWQLRIVASRGDETFTMTADVDTAPKADTSLPAHTKPGR